MTTAVTIKVTVDNVKKKDSNTYKGDFTFKQTAGSPTVLGDDGKIDLSEVTGDTDISFDWGTPQVEIGGAMHDASWYYRDQTGLNILISKGKDSDPLKSGSHPKFSGTDEFLVNQAPSTAQFTLMDKNSDGGKYAYCLIAYVNIDGGKELICDPKIINKPD